MSKGKVEEVPPPVVKEEGPVPVPGNGTFMFPDGSKYVGDFIDTAGVRCREGEGVFTFGPESYSGGWKADLMHGRGRYRFASGDSYEGYFVNGLFEGEGLYKFADGATYKGSWKQNSMHGNGIYTDAKDDKWEGTFFNGLFDAGKSYISLRPTMGL